MDTENNEETEYCVTLEDDSIPSEAVVRAIAQVKGVDPLEIQYDEGTDTYQAYQPVTIDGSKLELPYRGSDNVEDRPDELEERADNLKSTNN